jgi:hypothetical protein
MEESNLWIYPVNNELRQKVRDEPAGKAESLRVLEYRELTWHVGRSQNTRESERQVRGRVELMGAKGRCEQ